MFPSNPVARLTEVFRNMMKVVLASLATQKSTSCGKREAIGMRHLRLFNAPFT